MQTVNIRENEEQQRKLIREFIKNVREKKFLNDDDFKEVFEFFSELISLECNGFDIEAECGILNNKLDKMPQSVANTLPDDEWMGLDIASTDYSDTKGKDISFLLDNVFFCKRYFGRDDLNERLEGVVRLLVTIYHEVEHAVKIKNLSRNYLSPEILEVSRETLVIDALGRDFYEENYEALSMEKYAEGNAYTTTLAMIDDLEVLELAKEAVKQLTEKQKNFSPAKIGKLKYDGNLFSRDMLITGTCHRKIKEDMRTLFRHPIFEKQYNIDGTEKNIHELFEEMTGDLKKIIHRYSSMDSSHKLSPLLQKEYFDCQMFYYELILPQLNIATEEDYKSLAKKYGVLSLQNLFSGMEKYFNSKAYGKLECASAYQGENLETVDDIKRGLKSDINSIIRFRNGATLNPIAETLLREGGFVRGTREILPFDITRRREVFANSLIGVYDAVESEAEYTKRAENEKMDIGHVIDALYYNRFENFLNNIELSSQEDFEIGRVEVVRVAQVLKMAKLLSAETGRGYFSEFLKVPDVNRLMAILEKDSNGYIKDSIVKSRARIKKVVYPPTEAENGKYRDYILGNDNTVEGADIKRKIEMLNEEISSTRRFKRSFGKV